MTSTRAPRTPRARSSSPTCATGSATWQPGSPAQGCDYIQLDAPNYGSLCDPATRAWHESVGHDLDAEIAFDGALDSSVFEGLDGTVTRAIHICRGNQSGGTWHSSGGYGALSGVLFPALDVDVALLEYDSDRAGDFGPLAELKSGQTAVLGLLTTKTPDHERRDAVEARIAEAAEHKPLGELALSTQCGFASSTNAPMGVDDERAKLALVGEIARRSGADDDVARIVLGVGTSHSPLLSIPPEYWAEYARNDRSNRELAFPPDGLVRGFDAALESHVPSSVRERVGDEETFKAQHARCNAALDALGEALGAAEPDVTVVISDDQDEWFYDTNMPAIAVFWGASVPLIPRQVAESAPPWEHFRGAGYGDVRLDVAVPSALGRHVVEEMMAADFDVAQLTEVADLYGGRVARRYPTPTGETDLVRETAPRAQGLPHGFSFVVKRLFDNKPGAILPVFQNTCYPPNQVRPHRAYDFGVRLAEAIASFPEDLRVAVVASGGLQSLRRRRRVSTGLCSMESRTATGTHCAPFPGIASTRPPPSRSTGSPPQARCRGPELGAELVDYVPVYRTEGRDRWGMGVLVLAVSVARPSGTERSHEGRQARGRQARGGQARAHQGGGL